MRNALESEKNIDIKQRMVEGFLTKIPYTNIHKLAIIRLFERNI